VIRKAIVPVAGKGTRLLPLTKAIPKALLPLADLPAIHYIVDEAIASGIKQLIMITGPNDTSIEDYFTKKPDLIELLIAKNDTKTLEKFRQIEESIDVTFIKQPVPLGTGHAVLMAEKAIGNEPFAIMMGDDLVMHPQGRPCLRQLIDIHEQQGDHPVFACMRLALAEVTRFGIIAGEMLTDRLVHVTHIVEKPSIEDAPSQLGIFGRYVVTPDIFEFLHNTTPSRNGEIQLTDALIRMMEHYPVYAYEFEGTRYDAGEMLPYLMSFITLALQLPDLGPQLRAFLRTLELDDRVRWLS
jgi:UTP--glucose-1-phosphate uridylyltransferase